MSKSVKTLNHLQDYLDDEFAWRLKEISSLKLVVKQEEPGGLEVKTLLRAAVPLLYAHWEGYIKNSAQAYLEFVSSQRCSYQDLASCFIVFCIKKKLNDLVSPNKPNINITVVDFFLNDMGKRANLLHKNTINTQSNLSSSVFEDIAISIGIDPSPYSTKYNLIDKSLLYRRNHIAHGSYLEIDSVVFRELADTVIELLRCFKTDIENAASLARYKRTA